MIHKRPGRSYRRRRNRKERSLNYTNRFQSAIKIQKAFRLFLTLRYKELAHVNYDDMDYIDMEPVSLIPKGLLISLEGTGYNALSLLSWLKTKNSNPVTREPLQDMIPFNCIDQLEKFKDQTRYLSKGKGYYAHKRQYIKVLLSYKKIQNRKFSIIKRINGHTSS